MNTGELDERPPAVDDREQKRALAFGEEFRLGTLLRVTDARQLHKYTAWGMVTGFFALFLGIPVVLGVNAGPYLVAAKVLTDVVVALLFAGCCALFGAGRARTAVTTRLYRYTGGLAQLVGDEPEPRVAHWADVHQFTVTYYEADEVAARLNGFSVAAGTGTPLPGLSGWRRRHELRAVTAEAERQLAPRLVPVMTGEYDCGATVSFSRVLVSQLGITLEAWYPPGELIPWRDVKSVHMTYIDAGCGDYVNEITIGRKGRTSAEIHVSNLPNGIFLAALLSYAARRQGVTVTGYHGDGGGIARA